MAKIFVSIPILGKPEFKSIHSVFMSLLRCPEHQVRLFVNENDSLISRVRNVHITVFLDEAKECDYFMSIDSDIQILNQYPTNNIFSKLVSHNVDFVGGLYPLKRPGKPTCSSVAIDRCESFEFDNGLKEMLWLSSGCWMLKRSAVEKMVNAYPELDYSGDDNMSGKKVHGLYIPYLSELEEDGKKFKKYLSEDWAFCERWRNIGGRIFADTSIALNHIGKVPFSLWDFQIEKTTLPPSNNLPEPGWHLNKELP